MVGPSLQRASADQPDPEVGQRDGQPEEGDRRPPEGRDRHAVGPRSREENQCQSLRRKRQTQGITEMQRRFFLCSLGFFRT